MSVAGCLNEREKERKEEKKKILLRDFLEAKKPEIFLACLNLVRAHFPEEK
jgi:hypothetical protein